MISVRDRPMNQIKKILDQTDFYDVAPIEKQLIDDWSRLGPVRLPPAEDHEDQHRYVLHPLAHRARNNSRRKNITS